MGLDQYMFICRKATDDELEEFKKNFGDYDAEPECINYIDVDANPHSRLDLAEIEDLVTEMILPAKTIDWDAFQKFHDVPENYTQTGVHSGPDVFEITYRPFKENGHPDYEGEPLKVSSTWEEIEQRFTVIEDHTFWVWFQSYNYLEEQPAGCDRKFFELVDNRVSVQNCHFHCMDTETLKYLILHYDGFRPMFTIDGERTVYQAWW